VAQRGATQLGWAAGQIEIPSSPLVQQRFPQVSGMLRIPGPPGKGAALGFILEFSRRRMPAIPEAA
jgi:hypothetical protein